MKTMRKIFPLSDTLSNEPLTFGLGLAAQFLACLSAPVALILVIIPLALLLSAVVAILTPVIGLLLAVVTAFVLPLLGIILGAIIFLLSILLGVILVFLTDCGVAMLFVLSSSCARLYFFIGAIMQIVFFVKEKKSEKTQNSGELDDTDTVE